MNGDSYASRDSGRSREYYGGRSDREERRDRGERGGRSDRGDRRERERRRSRSPHSRSGRREQEPDLYSSSRDYRAREREDRYQGGRRDEREWDRDRGDRRREHRREDDDRPSRRDREGDERSRGGRGRDRGDAFGGRDRRKSASPPPKKREPTPDLTDVVPILERKRRLTQWDIKPPGYDHVTAEQAKLSGMFPLPGAPRQQAVDPSRLQAFMNQPTGTASNTLLKPSNSRQAKRLFVHNIPSSATEEGLVQFFNLQLNGLNVIKGVDPCVSAQLSKDKAFGLLEFRSADDTTVALAFDGISMEDGEGMDTSNGDANGSNQGLSLRRPKDYIVPTGGDEEPHQEGVVASSVPDSPNKICVSNIPPFIEEEPVTMLLVSFGELKSFVLVKDNGTGESRGIAFCEYLDPLSTDIAVENLNGMELGNKRLKVVRASIGTTQASGLDMGVNAMSMYAKTTSQDLEAGRVLQLLNMVTPEELIDNDDYEEICDDVREECVKYGQVLELKIPRPTGNNRQAAGVGKIYVKFDNNESASKALKALAGRKFQDRTVVTTYFSEENFDVNAW
ncbi:hypothetical protein FQN50_008127 [Emmonsiellopsis sp. PD_5]|nr:hypothetical protein FQN50_008127 [Emmonsiellopsis sp. PD_5]